ncbi:MAG: hypothetical protein AB7O97_08670 [Planctomycetota bacterium]
MSNGRTKQRQDKIDATKKALKAVVDIKVAALSRADELPKGANFADAVPHFLRMQGVFTELHGRDITRLTSEHLDQVNQACGQFQAHVHKITQFDINSAQLVDACRNINAEIAGAYDAIMKPLILPLAFTATQQTDFLQIERQAKGFYTDLKTKHDEMAAFIEKAKVDAEQALNAVREVAAEAGVASNAQIFDAEAKARADAAQQWLTWTVGMTVLTALAATLAVIVVFYWTPQTVPQAIQYTVSKLILLSVLTLATVWCGKNYRSQKHNETLNRHRAHALMTFQAFVSGTKDPNVSDAVLVQASHAAFQGRPTGYEAMNDSTSNASPFVDIVAKTAGKAVTSSGT